MNKQDKPVECYNTARIPQVHTTVLQYLPMPIFRPVFHGHIAILLSRKKGIDKLRPRGEEQIVEFVQRDGEDAIHQRPLEFGGEIIGRVLNLIPQQLIVVVVRLVICTGTTREHTPARHTQHHTMAHTAWYACVVPHALRTIAVVIIDIVQFL